MATTLRSSVAWVHRWTGLTIGVVGVFLAITGGVLAARPQLDHMVHHNLLQGASCARPLPMDTLAAAARRAAPGATLEIAMLKANPGAATVFRFKNDDQVYVDSCTGQVLGLQNRWHGVFGASEWLHRFFFVQNGPREMIVGVASAVLALLGVVGGMYLWWPRRAAAWKASVKLNPKLKGRAFVLNLHSRVGLYTSVLVFVAALTGVPIAFAWAQQALYPLTRSAERKDPPPKSRTLGTYNMQRAWDQARSLLPAPPRAATLRFPKKPDEAVSVYMIAADAPHGQARSYAYVDRTTGEILAWRPYSELPRGKQLYYWMLAIHMGDYGGLPVQMALLVGMMGVPVMGYTGVDGWLRRRARRRGGKAEERMRMRVARIWDEAIDVRGLELVSANGQALSPFTAGAHIDVRVGDVERQYSLCNGPRQTKSYIIAVRLEPASRGGSAALHNLREGDEVLAGAPRNHFPLQRSATRHVLVAAGIGITPVLSMVRHLAPTAASFELHSFVRSEETAAFRRCLAEEFGPRAELHVAMSRAEIRATVAGALGSRQKGAHLYVCGPPSFMDMVKEEATRAGWPANCVHRENFAADAAALAAPKHEVEVSLARRGAEYLVPPERTILEVLAEHGVDVAYSCETGVCGSCLCGVVEGEIDHRDAFLSEAERAGGDQMLICVSRAKGRRLVLDL